MNTYYKHTSGWELGICSVYLEPKPKEKILSTLSSSVNKVVFTADKEDPLPAYKIVFTLGFREMFIATVLKKKSIEQMINGLVSAQHTNVSGATSNYKITEEKKEIFTELLTSAIKDIEK